MKLPNSKRAESSPIPFLEAVSDEVDQLYSLIISGEATRNELESVSELNVLWNAIILIIKANHFFQATRNLSSAASSLPVHTQRFLGALLSTFELLVDQQQSNMAYLVDSLGNFFSDDVTNKRDGVAQLVNEYRSIFSYAYTFCRRTGRYPQPQGLAINKFVEKTKQASQTVSKTATAAGTSTAVGNKAVARQPSTQQQHGEGEDDLLDDSFEGEIRVDHMQGPMISAPSILPLKPISQISADDDNYGSDYQPHSEAEAEAEPAAATGHQANYGGKGGAKSDLRGQLSRGDDDENEHVLGHSPSEEGPYSLTEGSILNSYYKYNGWNNVAEEDEDSENDHDHYVPHLAMPTGGKRLTRMRQQQLANKDKQTALANKESGGGAGGVSSDSKPKKKRVKKRKKKKAAMAGAGTAVAVAGKGSGFKSPTTAGVSERGNAAGGGSSRTAVVSGSDLALEALSDDGNLVFLSAAHQGTSLQGRSQQIRHSTSADGQRINSSFDDADDEEDSAEIGAHEQRGTGGPRYLAEGEDDGSSYTDDSAYDDDDEDDDDDESYESDGGAAPHHRHSMDEQNAAAAAAAAAVSSYGSGQRQEQQQSQQQDDEEDDGDGVIPFVELSAEAEALAAAEEHGEDEDDYFSKFRLPTHQQPQRQQPRQREVEPGARIHSVLSDEESDVDTSGGGAGGASGASRGSGRGGKGGKHFITHKTRNPLDESLESLESIGLPEDSQQKQHQGSGGVGGVIGRGGWAAAAPSTSSTRTAPAGKSISWASASKPVSIIEDKSIAPVGDSIEVSNWTDTRQRGGAVGGLGGDGGGGGGGGGGYGRAKVERSSAVVRLPSASPSRGSRSSRCDNEDQDREQDGELEEGRGKGSEAVRSMVTHPARYNPLNSSLSNEDLVAELERERRQRAVVPYGRDSEEGRDGGRDGEDGGSGDWVYPLSAEEGASADATARRLQGACRSHSSTGSGSISRNTHPEALDEGEDDDDDHAYDDDGGLTANTAANRGPPRPNAFSDVLKVPTSASKQQQQQQKQPVVHSRDPSPKPILKRPSSTPSGSAAGASAGAVDKEQERLDQLKKKFLRAKLAREQQQRQQQQLVAASADTEPTLVPRRGLDDLDPVVASEPRSRSSSQSSASAGVRKSVTFIDDPEAASAASAVSALSAHTHAAEASGENKSGGGASLSRPAFGRVDSITLISPTHKQQQRQQPNQPPALEVSLGPGDPQPQSLPPPLRSSEGRMPVFSVNLRDRGGIGAVYGGGTGAAGAGAGAGAGVGGEGYSYGYLPLGASQDDVMVNMQSRTFSAGSIYSTGDGGDAYPGDDSTYSHDPFAHPLPALANSPSAAPLHRRPFQPLPESFPTPPLSEYAVGAGTIVEGYLNKKSSGMIARWQKVRSYFPPPPFKLCILVIFNLVSVLKFFSVPITLFFEYVSFCCFLQLIVDLTVLFISLTLSLTTRSHTHVYVYILSAYYLFYIRVHMLATWTSIQPPQPTNICSAQRYAVLSESATQFCVLRIYSRAAPSAWGLLPVGLKASVPLSAVEAVEALGGTAVKGEGGGLHILHHVIVSYNAGVDNSVFGRRILVSYLSSNLHGNKSVL